MALINGATKGWIRQMGRDELGNCVFVKLQCNLGPPIMIITMYQVVDVARKRTGTKTTTVGKRRVDIVAGDLDETMGETTIGLTMLHADCEQVDAVLDRQWHNRLHHSNVERKYLNTPYLLHN